jgi:hypothetical protein
MKHIWEAIELCHRKLVNERERLAMAVGGAEPVAATASSSTVTIDRTKELLDEVDAQLRAVTAARRDYENEYGESAG